MAGIERADAARNRRVILEAAGALFEAAGDHGSVTMDDVAVAAGVGKGTLFRRFGDRAGLVRAVYDFRVSSLTEAVASGPPPLGPGTPVRERVPAVLAATVDFKLANRQLTLALERLDTRSLFETPHYQRVHALLAELAGAVLGAERGVWAGHALLSLVRIDLVDHMLSEGRDGEEVQRNVRDLADRILGGQGL